MNILKPTLTNNNYSMAPILALHGTASSSLQWKALIQANEGYRDVYALDLPGYGQEPLPKCGGLAHRLPPLVCKVQKIPGPIHLVAHSFGGLIALKLAELMPEKFISVSLYEPTVLGVLEKGGQDEDISHIEAVKLVAERVTQSTPLEAMSHFIEFWMGPKQWPNMATKTQQGLATYAKVASQDFKDALFDLTLNENIKQYNGPLNILYGGNTVSIAKRICYLFGQQYRNCQVKKLDGLGHMGPLQQPGLVNHEFMEFIAICEQSLLLRGVG
jgi:pimeloyl-ACP methyl ester carboxylesterase